MRMKESDFDILDAYKVIKGAKYEKDAVFYGVDLASSPDELISPEEFITMSPTGKILRGEEAKR